MSLVLFFFLFGIIIEREILVKDVSRGVTAMSKITSGFGFLEVFRFHVLFLISRVALPTVQKLHSLGNFYGHNGCLGVNLGSKWLV